MYIADLIWIFNKKEPHALILYPLLFKLQWHDAKKRVIIMNEPIITGNAATECRPSTPGWPPTWTGSGATSATEEEESERAFISPHSFFVSLFHCAAR